MTLMLIFLGVAIASAIGVVVCFFKGWTEDWAGVALPFVALVFIASVICLAFTAGAYFSHPHIFKVGWGWME